MNVLVLYARISLLIYLRNSRCSGFVYWCSVIVYIYLNVLVLYARIMAHSLTIWKHPMAGEAIYVGNLKGVSLQMFMYIYIYIMINLCWECQRCTHTHTHTHTKTQKKVRSNPSQQSNDI